MMILPLYFINAFGWQNGKGLPWGQTTMQGLLFDGRPGRLLWRHRLEASQALPRATDSMAEAAMESFALVTGQLVTEIQQLPLDSWRTSAPPPETPRSPRL